MIYPHDFTKKSAELREQAAEAAIHLARTVLAMEKANHWKWTDTDKAEIAEFERLQNAYFDYTLNTPKEEE